AGLGGAEVCCRRTSRQAPDGAYGSEIRSGAGLPRRRGKDVVVLDLRPGHTGGHVPEEAVTRPAEACAPPGEPVYLLLAGPALSCIGEYRVRAVAPHECDGGLCGVGQGVLLVAPVPIAFEADQQATDLPVIAPLQAAEETHGGATVLILRVR